MYIIKRDGSEVVFDHTKIRLAVTKANNACPEQARIGNAAINYVVETVVEWAENFPGTLSVEDISDTVESTLMKLGGAQEVAKRFIKYRQKRELARAASRTDDAVLSIINLTNEEVKQENSNKNPTVNSVQRDYMAGEVSKDITDRLLLPQEIVDANNSGIIHFHDRDYFAQRMYNCCLVDMEDMLNGGTVISDVGIDVPKSVETAANIISQVVAQVASNQYGGQTWTLTDLVGGRHDESVNFVDVSRQKIREELIGENEADGIVMSDEQINNRVEKRLDKVLAAAMQTIQYQLITLQTTNGQAPFVSVFMYLNECVAKDPQKKKDLARLIQIMLEQRMLGVKDRSGKYITPAFPKLLYVLEEDNISEDSEYWYLTELAAKCSAKRLTPDYISEKKMKELKNGDVYPCMGCRSFLTPDTEGLGPNGEHKYYGRFNQGVVTINLVDIACSSGKDMDKFWSIFEDRMENLVHRALRIRHERLLGTPSDVAPILWRDGAIHRFDSGESIDELLFNNYSTISIGYAGLYECVYYMLGESHTTEAGREFGLKVMQYMNDCAAKWRADENISYSVYGTPIESTTYKFASNLKKRFGVIEGVTDHNYITNSYHINVRENISAFDKLTKEADFQALSPGGAISYVEAPDLSNNIEAVIAVLKHIYETIMYAEINTKSDYCSCCGYDGEIGLVTDEHEKLVWKCPNCGNTDQTKMHVARRTCGYIGTQYWNQGRTEEIRDRVTHFATLNAY